MYTTHAYYHHHHQYRKKRDINYFPHLVVGQVSLNPANFLRNYSDSQLTFRQLTFVLPAADRSVG